MNTIQRIALAIGLIAAAVLLAYHYLEWAAANNNAPVSASANRLIVPIYREKMVDDCPFAPQSADEFLGCDVKNGKYVYHWIRWHGLWVREEHSSKEGLFAGALLPLVLIVAAALLISHRKRGFR